MERLPSVGVEGQVGRFRPEQIAQRSTWAVVPNDETTFAAMHLIRMLPDNFSTETHMNPLDPVDNGYCEHTSRTEERTIPIGRI